MAGTNHLKKEEADKFCDTRAPIIIISHPQLGQNIGMVARAMLNCGLLHLRLINPKDNWNNELAQKASSGASIVWHNIQVFETLEQALYDINFLYATTARIRNQTKRIVSPKKMAEETIKINQSSKNNKVAILFGKESKGLNNDEISRANAIINIPLNPAFSSLNLAQSVLIMAYEYYSLRNQIKDEYMIQKNAPLANSEELNNILSILEYALKKSGFLNHSEKYPSMIRNIKNIFMRTNLTKPEAQTLRGIIKFICDKKYLPKD